MNLLIKKSELIVADSNEFSDAIFKKYKNFLFWRVCAGVIKNGLIFFFSILILSIVWLLILGTARILDLEFFSDFLNSSHIFITTYFLFLIAVFLTISVVLAIIQLRHRKYNIVDFVHWCDNLNDYQGRLLTAYQLNLRECKKDSTCFNFKQNIVKSASTSLAEKGFPSSFTQKDKKIFKSLSFVTVALTLVVSLIFLLTNSLNDSEDATLKSNSIASKINTDDNSPKNRPKISENSEQVNKTNEKSTKTDMKTNPKMQKPEKDKKKEEEKKDNSGDSGDNQADTENNSDPKENNNEEKPKENKPEEKSNNGNDGNEKNNNKPENNAKYEYDPTVVKSNPNNGESKVKKDNFYHFNDDEGKGSLIDAAKLASLLAKKENINSFSGFTSQEKKLIELYQKKLKKLLSSK